MSAPTDCLGNIIGLSRTACPCFDEGQPVDYDESDSGLYLDEADGINLKDLQKMESCANGGLWDMLDRARENAKIELNTDLINCIAGRNQLTRQPFSGVIGDDVYKDAVVQQYTYYGVKYQAARIFSGLMTIKSLGTIFSAAGTVDVSVYNDDELLGTYTIDTVNGNRKYTSITPLELPMGSEEKPYYNYYFIFAFDPANAPKKTRFYCTCGSSQKPYWMDGRRHYPKGQFAPEERWGEFGQAIGIAGNDISDRKNWKHFVNQSNGLLIGVNFSCKLEETICRGELNYTGNPLAHVMAYAVRFKAAENLIEYILGTGDVNRYNMRDREYLWGKRNHNRAEYDKRIDYLCTEISKPEILNAISDCFMCKDESGFMMSGIFS